MRQGHAGGPDYQVQVLLQGVDCLKPRIRTKKGCGDLFVLLKILVANQLCKILSEIWRQILYFTEAREEKSLFQKAKIKSVE